MSYTWILRLGFEFIVIFTFIPLRFLPRNPTSRVLKARYFPDCHLLQANRTGGCSYTWSGLWEAKEVIKEGLRWVLGVGKTINIHTDKWLRGKSNFCVDQTARSRSEENAKVCDFFNIDSKTWDAEKVRNKFNNIDADVILATRIPQIGTRDRLAWVHSSSGQYTVKLGYQVWHVNHIGNLGTQQSNGWDMIWHLNIPHKIKIFLWRFCRNTIPVRNLLRGKGIPAPVACSMCVGDVEHLLHLFCDCSFATACWQRVGLEYNMWEVENASEWLLDKLCTESNENKIKLATVLWGIWYARNKSVWEGKNMTPEITVAWSSKQVSEWREAHNRKAAILVVRRVGVVQKNRNWVPPEFGFVKINVDASVFTGADSFSLGLVVRDHQGTFIQAKTMKIAGRVTVMEGELVGILEALLWCQEMPNQRVIIESDSILSVDAINKNTLNYLELGDIIAHCRAILGTRLGVSVVFAKKQANKVAHRLARVPCALNNFVILSSPPSYLLETLVSDVSMF